MCDTKGVVYEGRTEGMNPYKARFAARTEARTLAEALVGADVFFGLSSGDIGHARNGDGAWRPTPSSSRSPTPTPKSPTTSRWPRGRMPSWPPAAPISPTR